jgi:hypothetical protein
MKSQTNEKIARSVLMFTCLTVYLFLVFAVIANALDTNLSHILLG